MGPRKPVAGGLKAALVAILILSLFSIMGSVFQIIFVKRSFIAEILTNESRSWVNQFWRIAIGVYILYVV